ncbi:MAG: cupin domain-containing protein [Tepidimonas sp.]|uniref:cupin domain-containing protein n=1 Tax=Tepidimonas sp. TaxID=2002775 RepID=UPI00298EE901|nr:cupin domain-containing protein [Tepidimonas sp.]MCS6810917.1 cupin domain-containing protein [Tepidimonas sp.]MDW8336049.1 cupin domain-containing protein [Tepidimonas sp.]
MHPLGTLDELPPDYRQALSARNLVPLWPSLRALLPPQRPAQRTQPTHWAYRDLRPLLLRAGELTPIEKAERRVLVLANPGHGLDAMQASAAIYLGMQLLLPGEWAPSHRHTPNAVRMVVEGTGAWTTVDGERCPMARGDLILTPTGLWHEHGHDGTDPVVWLDVLDLPLVFFLEASYHEAGARQPTHPHHGECAHVRAGVAPRPLFEAASGRHARYPLLRYPWSDVRAALLSLAADQPALQAVQVTYVHPTRGADAENILGLHALMLRPGQTLTLPARSPAMVLHQIEGGSQVHVHAVAGARHAEATYTLDEADTCVIPGYTPATLSNRSPGEPAFLFIADESPLHRKLGLYEVRPDPARPELDAVARSAP